MGRVFSIYAPEIHPNSSVEGSKQRHEPPPGELGSLTEASGGLGNGADRLGERLFDADQAVDRASERS